MKIVTHLASYFETHTHSNNGSNIRSLFFRLEREVGREDKEGIENCRIHFTFKEFCFQDSAYLSRTKFCFSSS